MNKNKQEQTIRTVPVEQMVSPFKQALDNWLSSNDGIKCINTYNIKMPPDQKQYLLNRLKTAFMAGWNAKEKMG